MKEHSLFLLASFPSKEVQYQKRANWHREQFENLLEMAVRLANGRVREEVLDSGEVVTDYTRLAECQTKKLTGIPIDVRITQAQERLRAGMGNSSDRETMQRVRQLNRKAVQLLDSLITLKEDILRDVGNCNLFTTNYPLLVEHILREARWYRDILADIESGNTISDKKQMEKEMFWNRIMMEHAEFIRGLLDPLEYDLMDTADEFAREYACLIEMARQQDSRMREELTRKTLETTKRYRDFKVAGTQGITECNIRSVILPLLADHVLREANHYLRLLKN